MKLGKFQTRWSNKELEELVKVFQESSRNTKLADKIFAELELEINERQYSVTGLTPPS